MEQKRTLWILVAAGVFLCVVVGTAFILYGNSARRNATAVSLKDEGTLWVSPSTDDSGAAPVALDLTVSDADSVEPGSSLTLGVTAPDAADAGQPAAAPEPAKSAITQADNVTVIASGTTNVYQIPDTKAASSNTTTIDLNMLKNGYAADAPSAVTAGNKAAEKAMEETASGRAQGVAKARDEGASRAAAKPAAPKAKPAPAKATPDRFWVQVASYSTKKKADDARVVLDQNKIQCEVFTFNKDSTLYYRVRVGPYTTKDEASYWKKQIDSIDMFTKAGTYIVNSSAPVAQR